MGLGIPQYFMLNAKPPRCVFEFCGCCVFTSKLLHVQCFKFHPFNGYRFGDVPLLRHFALADLRHHLDGQDKNKQGEHEKEKGEFGAVSHGKR